MLLFHKLNFQNKLFFSYSAVITIVLLLLCFTFLYYTYSTVNKNIEDNLDQICVKIVQQNDSLVKEMDSISKGLLFNRVFNSIVNSSEYAVLDNYPDYNRKMQDICNSLNTPAFIVYRIMIITNNSNIYYSCGIAPEEKDTIESNLSNIPWKNELVQRQEQKLLLPPHQDHWSESPKKVFSLVRNIIDINKNISGIIEIQQNYSSLQQICSIDSNIGEVMIFNEKGILVYPYNDDKNIDIQSYFDIVKNKTNSQSILYHDNKLISFKRSDYTSWTTIIVKKKEILPENASVIFAITLVTAVTLISATLLIYLVMTKRIMKPLISLSSSIKDVSIENLSLSISNNEYNSDVIVHLNNAFNSMFQKLKHSISELVQSRTNEQAAHFLALQSQMNPHFIYNTLSVLESLSYTNGNKQVAELCNHFSMMLRYSSDFSKQNITIKDEIENVNNYIQLMKSKYENYLIVNIDINNIILEKQLPKLTLQPLVENSFEHGFFNTEPPWTITISGGIENDILYIYIADNGCGISFEKLEQIYEVFKKCDSNLKEYKEISDFRIGGMGLANIYTRLNLMYSGQCSLTIENVNPHGCLIKISIKIIDGDDLTC